MKIVVLDNSIDTTGAANALNKSITEICSNDLEFIFVYPSDSKNINVIKKLGFRVYPIPFVEISKRVKDLFLYFPMLIINSIRLHNLIKRENVDIVHVNDIFNMVGLFVKLFTKVKVFTHIRRMPESFPKKLYNVWAGLHVLYSDRIIAVSEANLRALPTNSKSVVIYDPLPNEEKYPSYNPKQILNNEVKILYLANYTKGKGHSYAIEIISRAKKEFPAFNFFLNFYGGDFGLHKNKGYKDSLRLIVETEGLQNNISFFDKAEDVEKVMKDHDVVLNLSDSESFSRVSLEALFYGIPLIATDVGGTNEMVLNKETGILVKPNDVLSMYNGFKQLINNDELRRKCAMNSLIFVREKFGKQSTSFKLEEIYKTSLA